MYYYNLVVDNRSRLTDIGYTYSSSQKLEIGTVVYVKFGNSVNPRLAVVISGADRSSITNPEITIKEIVSVSGEFCLSKEAVEIALWMTSRYAIRKIDALKLFFPQGKKPKKKLPKDMVLNICGESMNIVRLTSEQEAAIKEISMATNNSQNKTFLLHGVTGSGKTEVYFRLIEKSIKNGKNTIYLVPEITHIDQILRRLVDRFGQDAISVIHSRLNPSQRFIQWQKVFDGKSKIVLGTRSALFVPLSNVGVVIMDEEHENAYKSDMTPKYDTVDIAYKLAKINNAVLILSLIHI